MVRKLAYGRDGNPLNRLIARRRNLPCGCISENTVAIRASARFGIIDSFADPESRGKINGPRRSCRGNRGPFFIGLSCQQTIYPRSASGSLIALCGHLNVLGAGVGLEPTYDLIMSQASYLYSTPAPKLLGSYGSSFAHFSLNFFTFSARHSIFIPASESSRYAPRWR